MEKRFEIREIWKDDSFYYVLWDNEKNEIRTPGYADNNILEILNEQDARIENLVSKLRVSNSQLASCELEHGKLKVAFNGQEKILGEKLACNSRLQLENQQLRQSQNSKAIEVLEKVRKFYNTNSDSDWIIDLCELDDFINNQINEFRIQNRIKNPYRI